MNEISFKDLLNKYSDHPAIIWPDGKFTYRQYFKTIIDISKSLSREIVQSESKVAVLSDINYHFPILFFAILFSGGIVVPINPKFPASKISALLEAISCDLIISFDESFLPDPQLKIKVLSGAELFKKLPETNISENVPSLRFDRKSTIVFTSGSRGNPRGVLHTIGNHYYSAVGSNQNIVLNSNDCWMIMLPFYHIAGIAILFRTLIAGAACYIPDSAKELSLHLKNYKVTHLSLVPTQLQRWLLDDAMTDSTGSLKAILLGGSKIAQNLIKQSLERKLPVFTSYGSTEMSSQITTTSGEDLKRNPVSSGRLLSHRELKINHDGDILVRGKTLGLGYVVHEKIIKFIDSEDWFHTGDLGYIDDNSNLIITGRRDNMFISGGENIYPEEIEDYLRLLENISDACVVDIPDREYGARPVTFVRMNKNCMMNEPQFRKYLKKKIAGYKIPVRFYAWPEGDVNLKPDRKYLRDLAISLMRSEFK